MDRHAPWLVWLAAFVTVAVAVAFSVAYPLYADPVELTDIGKLSNFSAVAFVGFVGGLLVLALAYLLGAACVVRVPVRRAWAAIICGGGLSLVAWLLLFPVNAIDIFIYSARARLWSEFGLNPSAAKPKDHWDDPIVQFASNEWAKETSPYGPLWNWIAAIPSMLGGDDILSTLVLFKLLAAICVVATGAVIVVYVRTEHPERAPLALLLFCWNPLVLWEGVGNGHNDVLVALLLVLGLLSWRRGWLAAVVPFVVAAALVKYVAAVFVPLAALAVLRDLPDMRARLRMLAKWTGISVALGLAALSPFFDVMALRESLGVQARHVVTSPAAVVIHWIEGGARDGQLRSRVRTLLSVATMLAVAWQSVRVVRRPARLPFAMADLLTFYLLVASWQFRAWYLIPLVALVALMPPGFRFARTLAWSLGAIGMYAIFTWVWRWTGASFYEIQEVAVGVIFLPPLVLLTMQWARWRLGDNDRPFRLFTSARD